MEPKRHIYRKSSGSSTASAATARLKKKNSSGTKISLTILGILVALYLFATAFCALKFNSLNPVRTAWGVFKVMSGAETYLQVADIPYKAFVATPEGSEPALMAMMEKRGYEYEEIESLGDAFIFGKETTRVRVVLSGNQYFTRWVFSKETLLPSSTNSISSDRSTSPALPVAEGSAEGSSEITFTASEVAA